MDNKQVKKTCSVCGKKVKTVYVGHKCDVCWYADTLEGMHALSVIDLLSLTGYRS